MTCLRLDYAFDRLEYTGLSSELLDRIENGKHLRHKLGKLRHG